MSILVMGLYKINSSTSSPDAGLRKWGGDQLRETAADDSNSTWNDSTHEIEWTRLFWHTDKMESSLYFSFAAIVTCPVKYMAVALTITPHSFSERIVEVEMNYF